MLTAAVIGLGLFALLAAAVLALMPAHRAAARVLILACVLALVGAALAVVGNRAYASCLKDAQQKLGAGWTIGGTPQDVAYQNAVAGCDTSHALGLRDPF